ncbi:MAG: chromate transporter [Clostridiaceae bacterium]|nr:chromate transporter [Clostridiaceae bacterium]
MDKDRKKFRVLLDLFVTFFKIGAFTIGGGLAMIPVIEKEIVDKKGYIGKEEIIDAFAVSQSLPGVIAINSAIYVGYRIAGFLGAVVTTLGVVLPSFIIILAIAVLFKTVSGIAWVDKLLTGAKAGIAGVIFVSVVNLSKKAIKDVFGIVIAAAAFVLAAIFDVSVIIIIPAGAILGYLYHKVREMKKHDTD